jgi:DNA-binding phage protein
MINVKFLREKIDERGVMIKYVAKKAGLSKQGFWMKLKDGGPEFRTSELEGIRSALLLTDAEFLKLFTQGEEGAKNEKQ